MAAVGQPEEVVITDRGVPFIAAIEKSKRDANGKLSVIPRLEKLFIN
jgi:hypothetical protein